MNFLKKTGKSIFCRLKILCLNFGNDEIYKYVACKKCMGCMRLPKHKGMLIVTCPECGMIFKVET